MNLKETAWRKCSRCHSEMLEEFFKRNRKGVLNKCCNNCLNRFKCSDCDYKTSKKNHLQRHIDSVHLKLKPFECDNCDLKFALKGQLQQHIDAVHLKLKPFMCNECGFKATRNGTLQRHTKVCTGKLNCSSGELAVMKILDKLEVDYVYDESYGGVKDKSYLRWDFRIGNSFIEYDGKAHSLPVRYGGISEEKALENLETAKKRDKIKNDYCADNGFPLLRIPYWKKDNIEELVEAFIL